MGDTAIDVIAVIKQYVPEGFERDDSIREVEALQRHFMERPRWIPVSERLPELSKFGCSKYVLTFGGGFSFCSARLWTDGNWRTPQESIIVAVTHWKDQLPEPPGE
jgi:hypothetical protein